MSANALAGETTIRHGTLRANRGVARGNVIVALKLGQSSAVD